MVSITLSFAGCDVDWMKESASTPYHIRDTQEVKTTWHPIGS